MYGVLFTRRGRVDALPKQYLMAGEYPCQECLGILVLPFCPIEISFEDMAPEYIEKNILFHLHLIHLVQDFRRILALRVHPKYSFNHYFFCIGLPFVQVGLVDRSLLSRHQHPK